MGDMRETVANARKNRQERTDAPTFVSGDVAGGVVREAEVDEDTEKKTEKDQQED